MAISQYILESKDRYRMQVRQRNSWLIRIRWFYMSILTGVAIVSYLIVKDAAKNVRFVVALGITGLTVNLLLWIAVQAKKRSVNYYKAIAITQIVLDLWLASNVVYFQGGIFSRATVLFAIPILAAGILFTNFFAYLAATFGAILYALPLVVYHHAHPEAYALRDTVVPIAFYTAVFYMLAIMVSRFSTITAIDERQNTYSELLAMLRHQLHHPTGVIAALTEMLEHEPTYPQWTEKSKNYMVQLKRENVRMNSMVTNLLEVIGKADDDHPSHLKKFDMVATANESGLSCATAAKRLNDLVSNLPNRSIEVYGNQLQLRVALDNLIENAFGYSKPGTPVTVDMEEGGINLTITVIDKGEGMTTKRQKALFSLFTKMGASGANTSEQQAKELYSMGLGLYVSKAIVERHHGSLELISKEGAGTKVIMIISKGEFYDKI